MKSIAPICSSVGILIATFLALLVPAAKADYTNNLLARWSFNNTNNPLVSDNGQFTLATGMFGTPPTLATNSDGSMSLGAGMELFCTNLNSTAYPQLLTNVTVWARMRYDGLQTNTPGNFGLMAVTPPYTNSTMYSLIEQQTTVPDEVAVGNVANTTATNAFGAATAHPPTPAVGVYASYALVFQQTDATHYNYQLNLNGSNLTRSVSVVAGAPATLAPFACLALGRLANGAKIPMTFDEVRVYQASLTPDQISQTGITNIAAYPDYATTLWNASVTVNPVINDYEPNGMPLTVVSVSPTNGTANIVNGTNVLITPTLGTNGMVTVGYTITNSNGGSASSLITVTVTAPVVVAPADQLVDSIGVNVHMWFQSTPYLNSYSTVKAKMVASKLRHVRDMLAIDRPTAPPMWLDLATNGIKTGYIFTPGWAPSMSAYTNFLFTNNLLKTVDYFEGPNEYDSVAATDTNWVADLTNFQASLYATVKGSSMMSAYPVLAPSFLINHAADRTVVGDISEWSDYGNCHPYPGGYLPSVAQTTNEISACAINTVTKPIYVTETGYHNATNGPYDGNNPASEAATALYLPRLYFDSFSRGMVRTYWYEFVESQTDGGAMNNAEAHFGLVRYDLSEKPAYTALTNLIAIMQDPGSGFVISNLDYSLSGASVKSVLFQKRDGSFYLALWQEVSVWNTATRTDMVLTSTNVTVSLPHGVYNVQSYSPTVSAAVQQTWTGVSNVTVSLQGEVKILKISGGPVQPVANPDTASTAWNVPVSVAALSNDSEPNGYPLTLLAVSPTNATAGIIGGTNVLVTPVVGVAGKVYVGYTITNGNGGAASSLITVTVTNPPTPIITSALKSGTNLFFNASNGSANGVYQILFTTNLALPVAQWTTVYTNTFNTGGGFRVTNIISPAKSAGFYQIKQ